MNQFLAAAKVDILAAREMFVRTLVQDICDPPALLRVDGNNEKIIFDNQQVHAVSLGRLHTG